MYQYEHFCSYCYRLISRLVFDATKKETLCEGLLIILDCIDYINQQQEQQVQLQMSQQMLSQVGSCVRYAHA